MLINVRMGPLLSWNVFESNPTFHHWVQFNLSSDRGARAVSDGPHAGSPAEASWIVGADKFCAGWRLHCLPRNRQPMGECSIQG